MQTGAPEDILQSSRSTPVTKLRVQVFTVVSNFKHPVTQVIAAPKTHYILVLCSCFKTQAQEIIQKKAPKEIQ